MASIVAKILGDGKGFDKTVAGVRGKLNGLKKAFGGLLAGLTVGAITGVSKSLIEMGSHLSDVSAKLGVSTDFLQEWNFMAGQSGIANTTAEMALQRFARRLGEAQQGTGELLPVLTQYNIALFDSEGRARSVQSVMHDYADVLRSTLDPQEKLRLGFKAFDSEGVGLSVVLEKGSVAMRELAMEAHNLGLVLDADAIENFDKASDRIKIFTTRAKVLGSEVLNFYVDTYGKIFKTIGDVFDRSEKRIDGFKLNKVDTGELFGPSANIGDAFSTGVDPIKEQLAAITEIAEKEKEITLSKGKEAILQKELARLFDDQDEKSKKFFTEEEKKTKEIEKQRKKLAEQSKEMEGQVSTLRMQADQFAKIGRFQATCQEIASGGLGNVRGLGRRAERIEELRARAKEQLLRGGEDSEFFKRTIGQLKAEEARFTKDSGGINPFENPVETELKNQTDELKDVNKKLAAL